MATTKYIERDFQQGLQHHRSGQLQQAEQLYRKVLAQDPRHADALHHLGMLALQLGHVAPALGLIRQAAALKPSAPDIFNSLGEGLRRSGDAAGALDAFKRAIQLHPAYGDAHFNLGIALLERSAPQEAEQAFRRAGECGAAAARVQTMLGVALTRQGKLDQAIASFRNALDLDPRQADTWVNLSATYERAKQYPEAVDAAARAVQLEPNNPHAHFNLGLSLQKAEYPYEALPALQTALRLWPDHVETLTNMSACYAGLDRWEEAGQVVMRALQLNPNHPESLVNLANIKLHAGFHADAEALCKRALELQPGFPRATQVMARAIQAGGRLDEAIALLRQCAHEEETGDTFNNLALALQDAGRLAEAHGAFRMALELKPQSHVIRSNYLLSLHYDTTPTPQQIYREHVTWGERHAKPLAPVSHSFPNVRAPNRPLRIGYTSCDFRRHSVNYFIESVLAHHDASQFEIYCYSDDLWPDRETERLRSYVKRWHNIKGQRDQAVAQQINSDQIDIMVDLVGHTAHSRLLALARKPAPIQATYLGYADTTGVPAIDYRLTDEFADPPGATDNLNTEKLIRILGGTAWCYTPPQESHAISRISRKSDQPITFGCFNILSKVNDEVVALWARILRELPDSRLMMKSRAVRVLTGIRERFMSHGIDPDRLELLGRTESFTDHLELYNRMDISLDPFPYTGTTTTCEALWMGVPVITLAGQIHAARVGVSLLNSVRLPELIAQTPDDYVKIAVELARDEARLSDLQLGLRQRMSTSRLTDAVSFTRNLESAYRQIWQNYCM